MISISWRALVDIGCIAERQKNYGEAEAYYQQALEMARSDSRLVPNVVPTCLLHLMALYEKLGRLRESEVCLREVLQLYILLHGPESETVKLTLERLADICCRQGRFAEALDLKSRASVIKGPYVPPTVPITAESTGLQSRIA